MLLFTCAECGGRDVQSKCWANPNTDEVIDYLSDEIQDNWCDTCEKHVEINSEDLFMNAPTNISQ